MRLCNLFTYARALSRALTYLALSRVYVRARASLGRARACVCVCTQSEVVARVLGSYDPRRTAGYRLLHLEKDDNEADWQRAKKMV